MQDTKLESRFNVNSPQRGALDWLDQFAGYLELERNYSSNTIRAYINDLRQLNAHLTGEPGEPNDIDFTPAPPKPEIVATATEEGKSWPGWK